MHELKEICQALAQHSDTTLQSLHIHELKSHQYNIKQVLVTVAILAHA